MWPFLIFGSIFAGAATLGRQGKPNPVPWMAAFVVAVLFVGLRHSVGMDWNNYLRMIDKVDSAKNLGDALSVSEPFYAFLLALGNWSGGGIYVVNVLSTILVMVGVFAFARRTFEPWIALVASMPIFMVVVAMSANRQALAAGLMMLVIANWYKLSLPLRTLCVLLVAGCHASALIFLAFVAIDVKLPAVVKYVGIGLFSLVAIYILQQSGYAEYYNQSYGEGQTEATQSSGALYHVALNAIPAALYFLLPRHRATLFPTPLLRNMAFAALAMLPLVIVASAAAGRISLYWFPISMWVWAALPRVLAARYRRAVRFGIAVTMFTIMVVWLQYANSSAAHIPYENALFMPSWELDIGVVP